MDLPGKTVWNWEAFSKAKTMGLNTKASNRYLNKVLKKADYRGEDITFSPVKFERLMIQESTNDPYLALAHRQLTKGEAASLLSKKTGRTPTVEALRAQAQAAFAQIPEDDRARLSDEVIRLRSEIRKTPQYREFVNAVKGEERVRLRKDPLDVTPRAPPREVIDLMSPPHSGEVKLVAEAEKGGFETPKENVPVQVLDPAPVENIPMVSVEALGNGLNDPSQPTQPSLNFQPRPSEAHMSTRIGQFASKFAAQPSAYDPALFTPNLATEEKFYTRRAKRNLSQVSNLDLLQEDAINYFRHANAPFAIK